MDLAQMRRCRCGRIVGTFNGAACEECRPTYAEAWAEGIAQLAAARVEAEFGREPHRRAKTSRTWRP